MKDKKDQASINEKDLVIEYGRFHKKPRTRREFLSQGAISGVGTVMVPSFLSLLSQRAMGIECQPEVKDNGTPFIAIDLSGGANIPGGNVMVGKAGGQQDFIADYSTLSIAPSISENLSANITTINGGNLDSGLIFLSDSQLLAGIKSAAQESTLANVDGAIFCTSSIDDTNANPHNPMYWINKAGLNGELVPLVGTTSSPSGGRAAAPESSINPAAKPVQMTSPGSTGSLVDLGLLANLLSVEKAEKVMKAISTMSQTQIAKFSEKSMAQKIKDLVSCGYISSSGLLSKYGPEALDPTKDSAIVSAFGNNFNGDNAKASAVVKLVLDGLAGAGTIELGGYDYHGSANTVKRTKDFAAGKQIGQIFEAAAQKNKPVVLYLFTDGGVSFAGNDEQNGRYGRGSDNSERSAAVLFAYNPKGKVKIRNSLRQIGEFNDIGAVNDSINPVSNSVELLTKLIVANYLALSGEEGKLNTIVGDNPFGSKLDSMLSFSADTLKG
ncbi:MAG: hypothetical protein R3B45_15870 [Bdellovibrionota bacterium]